MEAINNLHLYMSLDICLVVYVLLWGIVLWHSIKKGNKQWNVSTFIIASYFTFALLAGVLDLDLYHHDYEFEDFTLFPFIYLFLMLLVGLVPVTNYVNKKYSAITPPSKYLLNSLMYFYIFLTIVNVPIIISNMQTGLFLLMTDVDGGLELYNDARDSYTGSDGQMSNILRVFYNFFSFICIFLFYYYLTLPKKKKWVIVLLASSIVVKILDCLSRGQRTGPVLTVFTVVATFFMVKPFLTRKVKRNLIITGGVMAIALVIPLVMLTNSRSQNRDGGSLDGVIYYVGQAPLYFDKYCLDAGGIRYGDRTAPEFKRLLGFHNVPADENERRMKYASLRIDAYVFYTYVGDFVLDYGPIGAVFIFIFFSGLFLVLTNHKKGGAIPFYKLLLVYFVVSVCMEGGMYLFSYSNYGNYSIIVLIFLYIVFGIDYAFKNKIIQPEKEHTLDR